MQKGRRRSPAFLHPYIYRSYFRFFAAFFRVAFLAVLRVAVFFLAPAVLRAPFRAEDFLVAFLAAFFVAFFLVAIVILQYWSVAADRSPGGPAAVWVRSEERTALLTRPLRGS